MISLMIAYLELVGLMFQNGLFKLIVKTGVFFAECGVLIARGGNALSKFGISCLEDVLEDAKRLELRVRRM